jgi:hypothetical protein
MWKVTSPRAAAFPISETPSGPPTPEAGPKYSGKIVTMSIRMATSLGDFMITKEKRAYRVFFFRDHAAFGEAGATHAQGVS